jgi:hypothetical protein
VAQLIPITALTLAISMVVLPHTGGIVGLTLILVGAGASGSVGSVLGTGAVTESIEQGEQGAAIALVGLYRASARLVAPAVISFGLLVVSLPVAIAGLAGFLIAPGLWLRPGSRGGRGRDGTL